jgi:hypothetical protein
MKTLNLLTLASIALTAIALNISAADAFLSPRAKDLQNKIVPAVAADSSLTVANPSLTLSPRLADQQTKVAATVEARNMALGACAVGSPRHIERTGKSASASCCAITTTACNAPKACCAAN